MRKAEFCNLPRIFEIAAEFRATRKLMIIKDGYFDIRDNTAFHEALQAVRDKYYLTFTVKDYHEKKKHNAISSIAENIEFETYCFVTDEEKMKRIRSKFYCEYGLREMLSACVTNIDEFKTRKQLNALFFELLKKFDEYIILRKAA